MNKSYAYEIVEVVFERYEVGQRAYYNLVEKRDDIIIVPKVEWSELVDLTTKPFPTIKKSFECLYFDIPSFNNRVTALWESIHEMYDIETFFSQDLDELLPYMRENYHPNIRNQFSFLYEQEGIYHDSVYGREYEEEWTLVGAIDWNTLKDHVIKVRE